MAEVTHSSPTRILILGGGFGGVYTALHLDKTLAREPDIEVTLVSAENFLLFTPMLHEIAASTLNPSDIVNPLRRLFDHVCVVEAETRDIDLDARCVTVAVGPDGQPRELTYDRLVIATGSEDNFFGNDEIRQNAVTMKTLTDAMLLRARILGLLERAEAETDETTRRRMLTFVVAGGGFAGVEVIGALNDFVRTALRWYPALSEKDVRCVLVHPKEIILPELGESLGRYAQKKLTQRKVEILTQTKVAGYARATVALEKGDPIPAATLVWTAGVTTGKVIADWPCEKEGKRLKVDANLAVPGHPGVWALGDCASAIDESTGKPFPTTAQHAVRQGKTVAQNIAADLRGRPQKPFRFKMLGQLAAIGHRAGVAQILGLRFSGLVAWVLWRSIYLFKLPRLQKKLEVAMHWTADLFFTMDITQFVTPRAIEKAHHHLEAARKELGTNS